MRLRLLGVLALLALLFTGCGSSPFVGSTMVQSPYGTVELGSAAKSPDGKLYAAYIPNTLPNHVGIYQTDGDKLLQDITGYPYSNDLKGLAWAPDSTNLAVMYHAGSSNFIAIYNAITGEKVKDLDTSTVPGYIHFIAFSTDGKLLIVSTDSERKWWLPTGL